MNAILEDSVIKAVLATLFPGESSGMSVTASWNNPGCSVKQDFAFLSSRTLLPSGSTPTI
ncbi:hypothetical protein [Salinicoccus carnicancri]|uniref:hypothetical protein n=1 Tax=Salinicoccus carnicancri TaxID=558170 RepID=UPI0012EA2672|nr:hypothetical protein [Salinicoccus carnicancri]